MNVTQKLQMKITPFFDSGVEYHDNDVKSVQNQEDDGFISLKDKKY
jgi:hypothetical protein